jgi:DNA repair protein RecO (recombination protein O)
MPVYTSEALILRTYKLGEADRIVVFLTRDRGKKRGVAKGARRARSRYMGALEPMTRAGVAYYEREQRELVRINYLEPSRSPMSAATRPGDEADGDAALGALGHVGYFAELIDEWAPDAHADERLYRLGSSIVDALAVGAPVERLARYFEYWLLRLQGVYPAINLCAGCGGTLREGAVMPPREHVFVCRGCFPSGGGTPVSAEAVRFLTASATAAPEALDGLPLGAPSARQLETAHRRLINLHLEKELKSARVLREIRQSR